MSARADLPAACLHGSRQVRHGVALLLAACAVARVSAAAQAGAGSAAATETPAGQSWQDPPLGEVLRTADVVAEVKVLVGGQWSAEVELVRSFKGSPEGVFTVEGFNSYEWNSAYHAFLADETAILALYRFPRADAAGRVRQCYSTPTPSTGRFPVERGCVVGRFGRAEFMVEIPADDFRSALEAYFLPDPAEAARRLGDRLESPSLETRYLAIVLMGELAPSAGETAAALLAPFARDGNPAVREAAAHALGRLGGPAAARALGPFIADADRLVSRAAVLAACDAGSHGASRELVAWLARSAARLGKAPQAGEKAEIDAQVSVLQFLADPAWTLGADPGEVNDVVRGLVDLVASGRLVYARLAVRVLRFLGAAEAVPELILLLGAEDRDLRDEAATALLVITLCPQAARKDSMEKWWLAHKGEARSSWVEQALAYAAKTLREGGHEADFLARTILAASGDPMAAWAVREKLTGGAGWTSAPLEETGGPLVAPFAELRLASADSDLRLSAVRTLAALAGRLGIGGKGFAGEFLRASFDSVGEVRLTAITSLGRFGTEEAVPRLIEELDYGLDSGAGKAALTALRRLTGRRYSFYFGRGYERPEEVAGLDRWRGWWNDARATGWTVPGDGSRRAAPGAGAQERPVEDRLASLDRAVWLSAARELVGGGEAELHSIEGLARAEDARMRAIATALLGLRAETESTDALVERLADDEPFVRAQAVWAVGRALAGTGRPPGELIALVAEAFSETKEAQPLSPQEGAAEHGDAVWDTGDRTGKPDPVEKAQRLDGGPEEPDSVAGPPEEDMPGQPETPRWRPATVFDALALCALGKIGGPESLAILRHAASSDEVSVARYAVYALDLFPGDEAVEPLLAAVSRQEAAPRDLAARALARRRPPGTVSAVVRALAKSDYWQAAALTNALARAARPEDAGELAALLAFDPYSFSAETVAVYAAFALSRAPGPEATEGGRGAGAVAAEAVVKALESPSSSVRFYAAKAVGKLARDGLVPNDLRAAASAGLARLTGDFDNVVASAAASALEYAGDSGAAEALFMYLRSWSPPDARAIGAVVRHGGQSGLAYAMDALENGNWGAKYHALAALRYAPTGRSVLALMAAWSDPESPYQYVAGESLVAIGARAVAPLARVLRGGDAALRRRATALLGRIGTPEALAALREAAGSEDRSLALAAELALAAARGPHTSMDSPALPPAGTHQPSTGPADGLRQ